MWYSSCLQLMLPGTGQVGGRGLLLSVKRRRRREVPGLQRWGRYPKVGVMVAFGFVPSLDPFPGDSEKRINPNCASQARKQKSGFTGSLVWLSKQLHNFPLPKLHPYFLGPRFPTHQTDFYLILFYFMLCWCKAVFPPLSTLPPFFLYLFFFCCSPPKPNL